MDIDFDSDSDPHKFHDALLSDFSVVQPQSWGPELSVIGFHIFLQIERTFYIISIPLNCHSSKVLP